MIHWIHVIDEDAASVLLAFTRILKQALCFASSCPDSVLVHGPPCSLAKYLGVAVETSNCCERQLAARLTRMGRNRWFSAAMSSHVSKVRDYVSSLAQCLVLFLGACCATHIIHALQDQLVLLVCDIAKQTRDVFRPPQQMQVFVSSNKLCMEAILFCVGPHTFNGSWPCHSFESHVPILSYDTPTNGHPRICSGRLVSTSDQRMDNCALGSVSCGGCSSWQPGQLNSNDSFRGSGSMVASLCFDYFWI